VFGRGGILNGFGFPAIVRSSAGTTFPMPSDVISAVPTKTGVPTQPIFRQPASLFGHFCRLGVIQNDGTPIDRAANRGNRMVSQMLFSGWQVMGARIANRAIVTIQIVGWAAIIIVMTIFLTVIGASITECLANPR
jgi:hypothetical protein